MCGNAGQACLLTSPWRALAAPLLDLASGLPLPPPPQEEQRLSGGGGGGELGLLRQYMDAERLFLGSLGVRLTDAPRPHVLAELLGSAYVKQAAEAQQAAEVRQPQQEQARQAQH